MVFTPQTTAKRQAKITFFIAYSFLPLYPLFFPVAKEPYGKSEGKDEAGDEAGCVGKLEAFGSSKDVAGHDHSHEDGGEEGYPAVAASAQEPYGSSPQEDRHNSEILMQTK